eukprot:CAMPEP_0181128120 /NCGR_PEP_ID=MMETSP1071-20121207/28577_1 /TAXON_ID=35127 /ORGANISM="Thalassiosira sp., Strain NH16" /LENGTH=403 /DNA_ID=CAMNT_0023213935 /DNA_START=152 /DNA_END=1360 /DNA_ORIENTATION=+
MRHPNGLCPYHHRYIGRRVLLQTHSHYTTAGATSQGTCISKYATHDNNNNTQHADEAGGEQSCNDDDDSEPEYLELVTDAAEKMRSAVRDYVAKHSSQYRGDDEDDANSEVQADRAETFHQGPPPPPIKLVGILATSTPHPISNESCPQRGYDDDTHGNERYSEQIATCCSNDGIVYEPWRVPPTMGALERAIHHANERLDVHGILVFYPVFDKLTNSESARKTYKCRTTGVYYRSMDDYFRDLVACHKDVEGYCRKGLRIRKPEKDDALAVYKILESFNLSIESQLTTHPSDRSGKPFENITMTIINRSEVLGLPLATMLSNQGATIHSVNVDSILQFLPTGKVRREHATTTVEECIRSSSVIVSGVPSNTFKVPTKWIPKNATVINVATEESNFEEDTICE